MLAVLGITAPIFILIAIGFVACRFGIISRDQAGGMGRFVITFALPALVIRALLERPLADVIDWYYLLAYGLGSLLVFGLGYAFARFVRKDSLSGSALTGLGVSVSNSGFVGYPILVMAVGAPAGVALALGMMIENLLMIPLALTLAELGRQNEGGIGRALRGTAYNLIRHPVLIAITAALTMALLELHPPPVMMKVIDMLATASAPVALFVIGASLSGMKPGGMLMDVGQVTFGRASDRLFLIDDVRDFTGKRVELAITCSELVGQPAQYRPQEGVPVPCRVHLTHEAPYRDDMGQVTEYKTRAEVAVIEVGRPQADDQLMVSGALYSVIAYADDTDDGVVRGLWLEKV